MEDSSSVQEVRSALDSGKALWLETSPDAARFDRLLGLMRSCGNLFRFVRSEFPSLELTPACVSMLQEFAQDLESETYAFGVAPEEIATYTWDGDVDICRAAAVLAAAGWAQDILVTCSLFAHGQSGFTSVEGRSYLDAFWELLPGIAAALSPMSVFDAGAFDVPPYYLRGHSRAWTPPLRVTVRSLVPDMTGAQRAEFLEAHLPPTIEEWEHNALFATALALGIDASGDEFWEVYPFSDVLTGARAGDEESIQELGFAYYLYWTASESHLLLDNGQERKSPRDLPWLKDWRPDAMIMSGIWPPTLNQMQTANAPFSY